LHLPHVDATVPSFRARVLAVVRRIPPGRVATYGDVAALAGRPRAWRAVGNIMRTCRDGPRRGPSSHHWPVGSPGDPTLFTPCHRVVAAAGALGGYGGPLELKRALLRAEGLEVGATRIRRFRDVRWSPRRQRAQ